MKSLTQNYEFTEDEAELYDRQIRLWGVESQKRLRCARVLIIGVQGYGCEIAKNIILSGVQSVTLLDGGAVTEEDACAQFLAPRDQIGQNRAVASLARAQQLNPMVQVSADPQDVAEKSDSFFAGFDVICATRCNVEQLYRIDRLAQAAKALFFCGDVFGMFGYTFANLGVHTFEREKVIYKPFNKFNGAGDATMTAGGPEDKVMVLVEETSAFTSLQDALNTNWTSKANIKRLRKMDPSYFILKVLLRFQSEHGRNPLPAKRSEDLIALSAIRDKELAQMSVPATALPDETFHNVFAEVAPVCAIVAGITVQEIIKAVSMKEAPHNNFFFFNPSKCLGFVETVVTK